MYAGLYIHTFSLLELQVLYGVFHLFCRCALKQCWSLVPGCLINLNAFFVFWQIAFFCILAECFGETLTCFSKVFSNLHSVGSSLLGMANFYASLIIQAVSLGFITMITIGVNGYNGYNGG
jgi:hypothetical protein